ncbi:MAG: cytidylate kinase-like family protein [Oscillospiraceae bacterium]
MNKRIIITINRQYGSGGRSVGKQLAEQLNIPCYDYNLIAMAAKESGFAMELFAESESSHTPPASNSLLFTLSSAANSDKALNDKLYNIQSSVVRDVAMQGSCVIMGRCSDYLLKDDPDCLNIFIYADNQSKIDRIVARRDVPKEQALDLAIRSDKRRAAYYNYYTDQKWGKLENYDVAINTGIVGVDGAVQTLAALVNGLDKD